MKNPLVDFLRHYGPIPAQDNMYDERIHEARERAGVAPIEVPPIRLKEVLQDLRSEKPSVVILTGTAGDGKTFHCRRAFEELDGCKDEWAKGYKQYSVALADGRSLMIVKDLSEHTTSEKESLLPKLAAAAEGKGEVTYLVAANDGQLVASFRAWANGHESRQQLFREVEAMLVDGRTQSISPLRISMYNLSREMHGQLFEDLASRIVNHPDWSRCSECLCFEQCPIQVNRQKFADNTIFRLRLREVIDLSSMNDHHLPIRHLLMLAVNILLGEVGNRRSPLMNCKRAQAISPGEKTSPYSNVLGLNIDERVRFQYQAFAAIDAFGIGNETGNDTDDLLVYGHQDLERRDKYYKLIGSDNFFGEAAYKYSRNAYLDGVRSDTGTQDFLKSLRAQRQRLFFTLPDSECLNPWQLTVFRHADEYLKFCKCLRNGGQHDRWGSLLVKGLNRTFTGMMLNVSGTVLLCTSGGDGRSRVARFCSYSLGVGRHGREPFIAFEWSEATSTPRLMVIDPIPGDLPLGEIPLRITHFEYLMRVSSGSLPANFSRQCFEDFHDFKLKIIDKMDDLFKDHNDEVIKLVAIEASPTGQALPKELSIRMQTNA